MLAAIAVVLRWARWRGAETAVTDRRLIACRDAWRRREVRIALPDLDVEVQQSTLGRLLGYGTLRLAGARGEQVTVTYVPTPDRFRDIAARQGPRGGRRSG